MNWTLVTAPAADPVTLAEAKAQLNVYHSDDDTLIARLVDAATAYLDGPRGVLSRALVRQTWDWQTEFPSGYGVNAFLRIPLGPLSSITSITYYDAAGAQQTLDAAEYVVVTGARGGVYPAAGDGWPQTDADRLGAVTIRGVFGEAPGDGSPIDHAENVAQDLKHAILLHVAHMYENREAVNVGNIVTEFPMGYDALIARHRLERF